MIPALSHRPGRARPRGGPRAAPVGRLASAALLLLALGAGCASPRVPIGQPGGDGSAGVPPEGGNPPEGGAAVSREDAAGADPAAARARLEPLGQVEEIDAHDVAVVGTRAFVVGRDGILTAVDLSDPAIPRLEGRLESVPVRRVVAAGSFLYAASDAGLEVIDAYIPSLPGRVGQVELPAPARAVAVRGETAWVATGGAGLILVDISSPTFARLVVGLDLPGEALAVAVGDGFAAVGSGAAGVRLVGLSYYFPSLLGRAALGGPALDLALGGARGLDLFVAAGGAGLVVLNAENPERPYISGGYNPPGDALAMTVDGDRLLLVDGRFVILLDVSDPVQPRYLDQLALPGRPQRVALAGDRVYAACGPGGLRILALRDARPRSR